MIYREAFTFESHFLMAPRSWARDKRVSLKARGLLMELMSHEAGWKTTLETLRSDRDGVHAVREAVKELVEFGYLSVRRDQDESGRFAGTDYVVGGGTCGPGFDLPRVEFSESRFSGESDNRTHKEITSLEEDDQVREDGPEVGVSNVKRAMDDDFKAFWDAYGHKKDTRKARVAYEKARKRATAGEILDAVPRYLAECKRTNTFLKYPATWLNNRCWEDFTTEALVEASDLAVDALVAELGVSGAAQRLGVAYNVPDAILDIEEPEARRRAVAEFSSEWLDRNRQRLAERIAG